MTYLTLNCAPKVREGWRCSRHRAALPCSPRQAHRGAGSSLQSVGNTRGKSPHADTRSPRCSSRRGLKEPLGAVGEAAARTEPCAPEGRSQVGSALSEPHPVKAPRERLGRTPASAGSRSLAPPCGRDRRVRAPGSAATQLRGRKRGAATHTAYVRLRPPRPASLPPARRYASSARPARGCARPPRKRLTERARPSAAAAGRGMSAACAVSREAQPALPPPPRGDRDPPAKAMRRGLRRGREEERDRERLPWPAESGGGGDPEGEREAWRSGERRRRQPQESRAPAAAAARVEEEAEEERMEREHFRRIINAFRYYG